MTGEEREAAIGRLNHIRHRIEVAAEAARRDPSRIELVAVSKTVRAQSLYGVLDAGQRTFGENRVQEAAQKWPALRAAYTGITLHLIGPLQSNKARDAVALFDVIQSVDRPKIAAAIAGEMKAQRKTPRLFVQVNTGEEAQKAGVNPDELAAFVHYCRADLTLTIDGLMCIPPADEEPALHFALLAKLARENGVENLSMGMSGDFETAVTFGATHVRVGSAIFGAR